MPLTIVADKLDEIPESLRGSAKAEGQKFVISTLPEGTTIEDTRKLRGALQDEREARKNVARKLSAYGWSISDDGTKITETADGAVDPEIARQDRAAVKAGKVGSAKDPAEIEQLRKDLTDKFERDRAAMLQENARLEAYVADQLIEREALSHIRATGGNDDTVKVMLPLIRARTKVERQQDGSARVLVFDERGKQAISKIQGSADPMGIAEFVKSLKQDRAYAVNWPGKPTGGSGGDHATGGSGQGGAAEDTSKLPLPQAWEKAFGVTS
jgi:hypothetical protein